MKNAREVALRTLYKIEYEGAYSNLALKSQLEENELSSLDKSLATLLVYGVIQRKLTLEYIISQYSNVKVNKISKYILLILKLGIYQLIYMDKIPNSAAVNESVKLAHKYGHQKSSGFVNGILRNVIRNGKNFQLPKDKIKSLSVKYSFPEWIVKRWIDSFGEEFAACLMDEMNSDALLSVRVNTLKSTREEMKNRLPYIKDGYFMENIIYCSGFDIAKSEEYKNGYITIQDEAASLAAYILNPAPCDVVIDMCAAPGGKTTHMAELMKNKGKILAFDIHEHKIDLIRENANRLGIDIIDAKVLDMSEYHEEYSNIADKILIDAPCSGLGIIRRKPEIKWNRENDMDFSKIQYNILKNAASYLKSGGELLYSTCTIDKSENEEVIEKFLKNHAEFSLVDFGKNLPDGLKKETKGYMTLYPNVDKTDGFFIAKLKKD